MRTNDGVEFAIGDPANNDFPLIRVGDVSKSNGGDSPAEITEDLKLLPVSPMRDHVSGTKRTKLFGSHGRTGLMSESFRIVNMSSHVVGSVFGLVGVEPVLCVFLGNKGFVVRLKNGLTVTRPRRRLRGAVERYCC